MNNEILKKIIEQIKKYELTEFFSDIEEFKKWASKLNGVQINNFLSLDIELEEIKQLRDLLIDENNPENYYIDFEINRLTGNKPEDYYDPNKKELF